MAMHKRALFKALRARLQADLADLVASQNRAQESATHEEAKAEDAKDTRAIELGYLARGLAMRVAEVTNAVARMETLTVRDFGEDDAVALSALITVTDAADNDDDDDDDEARTLHYLLAPSGGGFKLGDDGARVTVVTPSSPLGQALLGKHLDDDVTLKTPRGNRVLTIDQIA